ncbi:MAG: glycyl-radical enzyme activating protein [Promethearchaeota archaeon]
MENQSDFSDKGLVFDIQRYSIHDGPGIRTIVFFKGCPLRCIWCQNPESLHRREEIGFNQIKCIDCGECEQICPTGAIKREEEFIIDHMSCILCGKCVDNCFAEALVIFGKEMTVEEILEVVEKDRPFYERTNGGVTLSGGEPTIQIAFVHELLKESKRRGLSPVIETCGYFEWENFEPVLEYVDWILFDLKIMDREEHEKYCGVPNVKILKNAKKVAKYFDGIIFRIPVIPGITDKNKNIQEICQFLKEMGIQKVQLIPYHKLGHDKYRILGKQPLDTHIKKINRKKLDNVRKRITREGIAPIIIE